MNDEREMITVVTYTIANDNETECASSIVSDFDEDPMNAALTSAKEQAEERFNDNGCSWDGARAFHTVITFPKPQMYSTEIKAELPDIVASNEAFDVKVSD